ncbi:hypothetical protein LDENG_00235880, partial [Lucifuga dentata]
SVDVQQLLVQQERRSKIQQVWSLSLNQEQPDLLHVKEEQEERGTRQEGDQLQHLEEADITKFPFTYVPVKTEDDGDKVESSQLHQSQTEENREAENPASSAGSHVEDCGGPGPSRNYDPGTSIQPASDEKISDSSEAETVDSEDDWKETRKPHSSLNLPKNHDIRDSDMGCKTGKKSFSCSECDATFKLRGNLKRHENPHRK